jgi:hypothetical protein
MNKFSPLLALAIFISSLAAQAGNGVERASLRETIDWSRGGEVGQAVRNAVESAFASRCESAYENADSITLVLPKVEHKRIDQNLVDVHYELAFIVRHDGLPPRWVVASLTNFDANSVNPELRLNSLISPNSGLCD